MFYGGIINEGGKLEHYSTNADAQVYTLEISHVYGSLD